MKLYIWLIAGAFIALSSCRGEDELDTDPTVLDMTPNFIPTESDNSEEAQMRRDFYNKHKCYLLFNDTLRHEYLGLDFNGDSTFFTETLDIRYSVGSDKSNYNTLRYFYQHMQDLDQKKQAVEYLEGHILPHIGEKIRPFSWLLTNKITEVTTAPARTTSPYAVTGQRGIVVANHPLWVIKNESQMASFDRQILTVIIQKIVTNNSSQFEDFYIISDKYYNLEFDATELSDSENTEILQQAGFITRGRGSLNSYINGKYPNREDDLNSYARQTISRTREQMIEKYADYPSILTKDSIVRVRLTSLGYVY